MTSEIGGPLVLVGCGKMGGSILSGWLAHGVPVSNVIVIEPFAEAAAAVAAKGISTFATPGDLPPDLAPAAVVFAVKPQQMDQVVATFAHFDGALFLSIAAGMTIGYFERHLGNAAAIVRAMPNTPAAVRRGVSVLVANGRVSADQHQLCNELMSAVGEVVWIEEEDLLDAVTAVSGSGPAYVFLLIETMAAAGVAAGLPADLAMRIARATVEGAGELVFRADEPAEKLRKNVTSPGGTTEAALEVLMAPDGLQPLMTDAIAAATRRSRELEIEV